MRLKRKLDYVVTTLGPVQVPIKKFRTRARCRRWCKAQGIKWFWTVRWLKEKNPRWIIETPSVVELQNYMHDTMVLMAKDLSEQYTKHKENLMWSILNGLDPFSL